MPRIKKVLAVETSCDDTSVAIVDHNGFVYFCESQNQDALHEPFGGIVPEIAGRNHTHHLLPLIDMALKTEPKGWEAIDAFAVTHRPGLVGSLLVGVVTIKSLALALSKPFIGVNHLEGHLLAPFLRDAHYQPLENFNFPFVALAVSGGHSSLYKVSGLGQYEVLGRTVDDAAGEAFDKFAKMVGLGFPGGALVDKKAKLGRRDAFAFPRAMLHQDNLNFSFSGLKTAALKVVQSMTVNQLQSSLVDLCASYQEAIVDALIKKLEMALDQTKLDHFVITGGVSANSRLRERAEELAKKRGFALIVPPLRYCTDNAAMIAYAGIQRLNRGEESEDHMGVSPEVTI